MNPYLLLVYVISYFFGDLDFWGWIHGGMTIIKYVRSFIGMFMPEPKGTVEHLRGFLKVAYFMDTGDGKGLVKRFILLPYSPLPKQWTKVDAVLLDTGDNLEEGGSNKKQENVDDDDLLADIDSIAKGEETPPESAVKIGTERRKVTNAEKSRHQSKNKYANSPKVDVTAAIEELAGPGKDFFGIELTPHDIDHTYQALIFHYGKKTKTFNTLDPILLP